MAGSIRHEWAAANGNSGIFFNGTDTLGTCSDAAFRPFDKDKSWEVEGMFSYPAAMRTGGSANYFLVSSMDATGAVPYQGFAFGIKWNGGTVDTGGTMPDGEGGLLGRMIPQVYLSGSAANQMYLNPTAWNLRNDVPHHFLVRHNATLRPTSGTLSLYIDGVLVASVTSANPTISTVSNGTPLLLGNRLHDTLWFKGALSSVMVYDNVLLTDAQMVSFAGRGTAPKHPIIYDSPLCNDVGQVQDLALLAQLQKYGQCTLSAVITDHVAEKSGAATRALANHLAVRPRIGCWGGSIAVAPGGPPAAGANYTDAVQALFPVPQEVSPWASGAASRTGFMSSLATIVWTLAVCPNKSVTYWCAGVATALAELMAASNATIVTALTTAFSAGGAAAVMSKLVEDGAAATPTGAQIATLKLRQVVVHGGYYPSSKVVGDGAGDTVGNNPEYNFRADATRWNTLLAALTTAATIPVFYVSMADAPGVISIGVGVAKANLNPSSSNPYEVVHATLSGQLNTAGERICYNAWSLFDLVWPGVASRWVECNDVTVDNTNARVATGFYSSYGENYFLNTRGKPNAWLEVNGQYVPQIKNLLQTLFNRGA